MKLEKRVISIPQGAKCGPAQKPIYGFKDVDAYCSGGLAVHKTGRGARWRWTVTHIASGLGLTNLGAMTKALAVANMERALALEFDWTLDEKKTFAAMREDPTIAASIRAIGNRD